MLSALTVDALFETIPEPIAVVIVDEPISTMAHSVALTATAPTFDMVEPVAYIFPPVSAYIASPPVVLIVASLVAIIDPSLAYKPLPLAPDTSVFLT